MKNKMHYYGRHGFPLDNTTKVPQMKSGRLSIIPAILIAISLLFGLAASANEAPIVLKGEIINTTDVDIQVFKQVNTDNWEEIFTRNDVDKYRVKIDPDFTYQIWFTKDDVTKIMHVTPGHYSHKGYYINIDFSKIYSCKVIPMIESSGIQLQMLTFENAKELISF